MSGPSVRRAALTPTNNLSDVPSPGAARYNLHVPALTPADCIATANVASLSGLQTFDGHTMLPNEQVLLTAQTTASQNGPWIVQSGAWARPSDFAAGGLSKARTIAIVSGTLHAKETWLLQTNGQITIDTTAQTWVQAGGSSAGGWYILTPTLGATATIDAASHGLVQVNATLPAGPCAITVTNAPSTGMLLAFELIGGGGSSLTVNGTVVPIFGGTGDQAVALLLSSDGTTFFVTGQKGADGGAITIPYTFDSTTTDADPGNGKLRLSNGSPQSGAINIRADLLDALGGDWSTVIDSLDDSTSAIRGHIRLTKASDPSKWLLFTVSAVGSQTGYRNISVANVANGQTSPFSAGDLVLLQFTRTGDAGANGAGVPTGGTTGQQLAKNSNTDYDTHWVTPSAGGDTIAVLAADVGPIVSQTAMQDITGLLLAIGASATEIWHIKGTILVNTANSTEDAKLGLTVPAGCTVKWGLIGPASGSPNWGAQATGGTPNATATQASTPNFGTPANGTIGIPFEAIVFGGGTAGNIQLQFAQNVSDAGNLTIQKGSFIRATKLAS